MANTSIVKIKVDVAAATKLKKAMDMFPSIMQKELGKAVVKIVLIIEREAKKRCPVGKVKGGTLRSSITPVVISWAEGFVGTNVEYAPFVEYGTKKMPARPYFEPAFLEGAKRAPAIFEDAVARALKLFDTIGGK